MRASALRAPSLLLCSDESRNWRSDDIEGRDIAASTVVDLGNEATVSHRSGTPLTRISR